MQLLSIVATMVLLAAAAIPNPLPISAIITPQVLAQSRPGLQFAPLCELQTSVAQGEHRAVRVEGVYLSGLEAQFLVNAGCSGRSTRIEFDLKTHKYWNRLVRLTNKPYRRSHAVGDTDPVLVVFEGEFYGPPMPDPKLPEAIRRVYHPGWDNNSMTKLVVHSIVRVNTLPADHPCAPLKTNPTRGSPCFQIDPLAPEANR